MRKRFLAMALALAMVLSLAIPAYAAEGDGSSDGRLDKEPEHADHLIYANDDEAGWGQSDITLEITEAAASCDHEFQYTDNGDGTHNGVCSKCGQPITSERHIDNDDHLDCDKCGAKVECTGHYFRYEENEGGQTHKKICTSPNHDEHILVAEEAHTLVEGTCTKCGYTTACKHETHVIESDGKGNHSYHCTVADGCGSVYKTEKCTDVDDDLLCDLHDDGCTYKFPCPHSGSDWLAENITSWTTNSDGTHFATCPHTNCGETITQDCVSADSDCTCDAPGCGYDQCHDYKWVDNHNDKDHTWKCGKCNDEGIVPVGHERTEKHADVKGPGDSAGADGLCDACGASMANVGVPVCVAEVPAEIPISATTDGVVTLPDNLWIENKSSRALRVSSVGLALDSRWNGVSISEDFASKNRDSKDIGFSLRGDDLTKPSTGSFDGNNWIIGAGDQLPLNPACRIAKQSATMEVATLGHVRFQLMWCEDADAVTSEKTAGASDQGDYNTGLDDYTIKLEVKHDNRSQVSVDTINTDKSGRIVQLPDVTPADGYAFRVWWLKHPTMALLNRRVAVGDKVPMAGMYLEPELYAVAAGTVTFDASRLSAYTGAKVEPSTLNTDASGYLTQLPAVTGLPANVRVSAWETAEGLVVAAGTQLNGDVVLYPIVETNAVDAAKVKTALQGYSGSVVIGGDTAGTDVSTFSNGGIVFNSTTGVLGGNQLRLPDNCTGLFQGTGMSSVEIASGVDTSNVTNTSAMFADCANLSSVKLARFDVSKVTNMREMFKGCAKLTSVSSTASWNTSAVTSMDGMFNGCSVLNSVNLGAWDVSKVTSAQSMFLNCRGLTAVSLKDRDFAVLRLAGGMFQGCSSLESLDYSTVNMPVLTDIHQMLTDCRSLSSITFGTGFNTSKVTTMTDMFASCSSLRSLDLTNFTISDECDCSRMFNSTLSISMVDCPAVDKLVEKGILTRQP